MQIDDATLYKMIGSRLRDRRKALGKSQEWLARRIGTTRTSITNIEAGSQRTPVHVLYAISSALGSELFDLLPRTTDVLEPVAEEVTIGETVRRMPPRAAQFYKSVTQGQKRNKS